MTELLPPDHESKSGFHVIAQDSKYKGLRFVEAFWKHDPGIWYLPREEEAPIRDDLTQCFRYSARQLAENNWVIVEEGKLT